MRCALQGYAYHYHECEGPAMNTMFSSDDAAIRILRLPQVCSVTGLGRSMIYQMEADQRFPKRVRIGTRAVGWLEAEVRAWLQKRIELSRAQ
jgi:prophage regulatory protein